jgi:hypothetical protein
MNTTARVVLSAAATSVALSLAWWWMGGLPVPATAPSPVPEASVTAGTEVAVAAGAETPVAPAAPPAAGPPSPPSATSSPASAAGGTAPIQTEVVVGTTPSIRSDLNANLRSVAEAARSGVHPERLTPLIAPAPYDHQRFLADPQAYLDVVEPGRVYQSAVPGEGVAQLELVGSALATIPQGGRTELAVRTVPHAPATFTSFECGAFDNHLTTITVRADGNGVATATFSAPPGTLNAVSILAGSPLASGQVNFTVIVTPAVTRQVPAQR